jgi:two-component system, LytTR family, sensor kinase
MMVSCVLYYSVINKNNEMLRTKKQEQELADSKIAIMLSQIQPHFLYNSLNSIYYLCGKDQGAAQIAISDFSDYLRTNLDSLKATAPVPFERELKHVQTYLSLEKMRFTDQLMIHYEIGTTDFLLPALTVQPLVENAVKYGVGKKSGGGTVTLTTRTIPGAVEIIVSDDGVGYDPAATQDDGRSHIGLDNVRARLATMSGGSLRIESTPGQGTIAAITIPKGEIR